MTLGAKPLRYQVIHGSESGHCCFEATVVDTATKDAWDEHEKLCECFDIEDAEKIAAALNASADGEGVHENGE